MCVFSFQHLMNAAFLQFVFLTQPISAIGTKIYTNETHESKSLGTPALD